MKLKLFKIKKRVPQYQEKVDDLIPKGIKETVGTKLPFNEMGDRQYPSSKPYTNLSND